MVLRVSEAHGIAGNDIFYGSSFQVFFNLQGDDTFHAQQPGSDATISARGSGNDQYVLTAPSAVTKQLIATVPGSFDGLAYIASYGDLISGYGVNEEAATRHYIQHGYAEGRTVTFDAQQYLNNYSDLQAAFGNDLDAATAHFIDHGFAEGRDDILIG